MIEHCDCIVVPGGSPLAMLTALGAGLGNLLLEDFLWKFIRGILINLSVMSFYQRIFYPPNPGSHSGAGFPALCRISCPRGTGKRSQDPSKPFEILVFPWYSDPSGSGFGSRNRKRNYVKPYVSLIFWHSCVRIRSPESRKPYKTLHFLDIFMFQGVSGPHDRRILLSTGNPWIPALEYL